MDPTNIKQRFNTPESILFCKQVTIADKTCILVPLLKF